MIKTNSRKFDEVSLQRLRDMPLESVLSSLGIDFKPDPIYKPTKDKNSRRLVVYGQPDREILITGSKWYDINARVGGGGGIDLARYLLKIDFVKAVKLLKH